MSLSRRLLLPGLLAGALIRLLVLPWPGSGDTLVWKVWSFAATHDVTAMYGIGGTPPERRVLHWQGETMTVDYPPLALVELGLAGRLYALRHPFFDDSTTLNAVVKLPGVACEIALTAALFFWGRRRFGEETASRLALFVWLNPAMLLDGPCLGYLDPQMAAPAVLALVAAFTGQMWLAGALAAAAVLTKAQAAFVMPAIAAVVIGRSWPRWGPIVRAGAGASLIAAALLLPFAIRGAWSNLTQALGRLATHDMLSAQAANVWWLFTYVLRVFDVAGEWGWWRSITQEVRILAISRAVDLGYPNARVVGLVLVTMAVAWAVWQLRRSTMIATAAAWTGWCAWAYALLAAQVHENHLYLAVPFLAVAAALDRRYLAVAWTVSGIAAMNLYLFEGFGADGSAAALRGWTIVDASVLLAIVNVVAFVWTTVRWSREKELPDLSVTREGVRGATT